jgi:hypothetical protein
MKAKTGDAIVCDCSHRAGSFRRDVEGGISISSKDIEISTADLSSDDDCYVCPVCKQEVARRFAGDRWRVRKKRLAWMSNAIKSCRGTQLGLQPERGTGELPM